MCPRNYLAHPTGKGQCTAWADLLVQVLAAQGIGAHTSDINANASSPYIGFRVQAMPAQGSGGTNYTDLMEFGFHEVVRVNGFADTIFDPSYGTRVDKSDERSVELKYEDEVVTHLAQPNPNPPYDILWILDPKGILNLDYDP